MGIGAGWADNAWVGTGWVAGAWAGGATAPVLSAPTAAADGATDYIGSVTTDITTGTLYFYPSANASETAATIEASGFTRPANATSLAVAGAGLTAETSYYLHFVQRDGNDNQSNVVSSAQFTTTAASTFTPQNIDLEFEMMQMEEQRKKKKPETIDNQNVARIKRPFFEGEGFADVDQDFDIL